MGEDMEPRGELHFTVGPDQREHLIVNGRVFYGKIDGFEFEEGYVYELRVEEYDGGERYFGYRLVEIVSQRVVSDAPEVQRLQGQQGFRCPECGGTVSSGAVFKQDGAHRPVQICQVCGWRG